MEKIMIDTDIGNDCDDAGALALCHALCEKGEAQLLAVTACLSTPYIAGCIDAINRHYNRIVPVGENYNKEEKRLQFDEGGCTCDKIVFERFNNSYKENRAEESLKVLRKTLAEAEDGSVTLVGIGYLTSLAQLIMSKPDDFSALSGKELVLKKVKRTVVMGGRFYETWPMDIINGIENIKAEFNIINDIKSAQTVCDEWCGELVFSSVEIGNYCRTLKDAYRRTQNPVGLAYSVYPWAKEKGRESWDLTAILYAIRPDSEYWYTHAKGKISVDDEGVTTFETRPDGKHTYLIPRMDYKQLEEEIDNIVKSSRYY